MINLMNIHKLASAITIGKKRQKVYYYFSIYLICWKLFKNFRKQAKQTFNLQSKYTNWNDFAIIPLLKNLSFNSDEN